MGTKYLMLYKFSYLKTPLFKWEMRNPFGGSFSNSGQFKSMKSCLQHAKANAGINFDTKIVIKEIVGHDENDAPVILTTDTYAGKMGVM